MLVEHFLQKQLRNLPEHLQGSVRDMQGLIYLAKMRELVCLSSNLFVSAHQVLDQYFAVEDQTLATKQQVLQVAGSLGRDNRQPLFQAVAVAATENGLPLREIETDVQEEGVIGKLDRTWYGLGTAQFMEKESIALGVTSQTLALRLENKGMDVLYLAQKQPKRLLAILGCSSPLLDNAAQTVQNLHQLGVKLIVLTEQKTAQAKALGSSLGLQLIHSELNEDEKRQVIQRLRENDPDLGVMGTPGTLTLDSGEGLKVLVAKRMSSSADVLIHNFADLPALMETAQNILARARKRFFWCKI